MEDAGISQFNLVQYTSMLPAEAEEISMDDAKKSESWNHGAVLEAEVHGSRGNRITAGVGRMMVHPKGNRDETVGGFATEYKGHALEDVAKEQLEEALEELFERRFGSDDHELPTFHHPPQMGEKKFEISTHEMLGVLWVIAALAHGAAAAAPTWQPWRSVTSAELVHTAEAEAHRVRKLPGWGKTAPVRMHSGYVRVAEERELFYVFVEAEEAPKDAPLILWLTGFHRFANIIYLDSPALVGFSYSNRSDDRETGDERTATDNLQFIRSFLDLFPALAHHRFWLAGESYAGTSESGAQAGHRARRAGAAGLGGAGFLAGNPSTDPEYDGLGRLNYWWSHGLISQDVHDEVKDACNFSNVILGPSVEVHVHEESSKCKRAIQDDKCMKSFDEDAPAADARTLGSAWRWALRALRGGHKGKRERQRELDPCVTKEGEAYLRRRDVQDALHANDSAHRLSWRYQIFNYSHTDQLKSQLPLYRRIMEAAPHLRILIYTGDTDALVPLIGTRRWTFALGREEGKKKKRHWKAWTDPGGQVGGYVEVYEDFTFATVRHASHEAPYTAPVRTGYLYRTFLSGRDIA
eukprot:scaffold14.g1282.t1